MSARLGKAEQTYRKTFRSTLSGRTCLPNTSGQRRLQGEPTRSDVFLLYDFNLHAIRRRPEALTTEPQTFDLNLAQHGTGKPDRGGARRDRTDDLMLAKHALSQLSYGPEENGHELVGLGRFERPTSPLSGVRSNQLSYRPAHPHTNARIARHPEGSRKVQRRKRNEDGGVPHIGPMTEPMIQEGPIRSADPKTGVT